jgi:hypothetical protein
MHAAATCRGEPDDARSWGRATPAICRACHVALRDGVLPEPAYGGQAERPFESLRANEAVVRATRRRYGSSRIGRAGLLKFGSRTSEPFENFILPTNQTW